MRPIRLLDVAEEREAPPHLLARLRDIDATAELLYVGQGEWWLGCIRPNLHRLLTGWKLARHELSRPFSSRTQWRFARLMQQGFAFCGSWYFEGEPTSQVVDEFRIADYSWRTLPDIGPDLLYGEEKRRQQNVRSIIKDRIHSDARWAHRRLVKGYRKVYSFPSARTA